MKFLGNDLVNFLVILYLSVVASQVSCNLIFANSKDLRMVNLESNRMDTSVIVDNLGDATALDFYYKPQIVFWSDLGTEKIRGVRLGNKFRKPFEVIVSGLSSPDGLAVDWLTGKLYWSDSDTKRIEVCQLDSLYAGIQRKVLFTKDIDAPRAIALVPQEGLLFWTDWGDKPKIERASMDGKHRRILINEELGTFAAVDLDWDECKTKVEIGLSQFKINSLHESKDMIKTINESSVILVSGGNTFHLLYYLQKHNLIPVIRKRVIEDGIPYIGWSAGASVACPDIGTTNDMPIIWPNDGDKALDLFPYYINTHFTEKKTDDHGGESRIKQLNQAFVVKKRSIIGLPEGTGIRSANGKFRFFRTNSASEHVPIVIKIWRQIVISDRHEVIDHPMDQLISDWQEIGAYS